MLVLLISLVVLLWLIYYFHNKDLLSPDVMFCASFVFSSIWATVYSGTWDLNLHLNTFMVIFGGVLLFSIVCLVMAGISHHDFKKRKINLKPLLIENWKLMMIISIEVIVCLFTARLLVRGNLSSNLSLAIGVYRRARLANEESIISLPRWLGYFKNLTDASGYFLGYVLANNVFAIKKKVSLNNLLLLCSIVLSIISNSLFGGRQQFINISLAFLYYCVLFNRNNNRRGNGISFRTLFIVVAIGTALLWAFKNASGLIGKDINSISFVDYMAKYCGAEIKNLDTFLQNRWRISDIWGFQSFRNLLLWMGKALPNRDIPYQYINGFNLGNVYTTFYDYIYDFGAVGMIFLVAVMAMILSILYRKVSSRRASDESIILCTVYGFQVPNILLSFFSNEFYIFTFSRTFFRNVIVWWLLYMVCFRIRFRNKAMKRSVAQELDKKLKQGYTNG